MAYKNKIEWSFNGYADQASAERGLEETEEWFRRTFDNKLYSVTKSTQGTPFGWRANFTAEKNA